MYCVVSFDQPAAPLTCVCSPFDWMKRSCFNIICTLYNDDDIPEKDDMHAESRKSPVIFGEE